MINNITIRTIQSGTIDEVYIKTTDAALYMATGGFLNSANKLLTALWKYKIPHDRKTWLADRAFMMLWYASNHKPDNIPFEIIDIDELERYHRDYVTLDKWGYKMEKNNWKEMTGTDLLRTAFKTASLEKKNNDNSVTLEDITAFGQGKKQDLKDGETLIDGIMRLVSDYNKSNAVSATDKFPSKEKELLAAEMLEKYIQEVPDASDVLSLASELFARNGQPEKAVSIAKKWAIEYHQHYVSYSFSLMACNRHVAPLLLQNILADELKISANPCNEFVDLAIKVLDKRMQDGRSLVYSSLSWKGLIKKLSLLSIQEAPEDFSEGVHKSKWIGFEKASAASILATEKKLGITLPEDYKAFLRTTNGLLAFPPVNPSLVPVEQIGYLRDIEPPELFSMYNGFPVEDDDPERFEEYVSRAILISEYPEEQMIWLIPPKEGHGDWQTWYFANWNPGRTGIPVSGIS